MPAEMKPKQPPIQARINKTLSAYLKHIGYHAGPSSNATMIVDQQKLTITQEGPGAMEKLEQLQEQLAARGLATQVKEGTLILIYAKQPRLIEKLELFDQEIARSQGSTRSSTLRDLAQQPSTGRFVDDIGESTGRGIV